MPVEWERIPDGVPEDFQALDGNEIVGRIYQIPTGPERGLWFWTMTAPSRPAHHVPDEWDRSPPRRRRPARGRGV
jgi:hypothetical protein